MPTLTTDGACECELEPSDLRSEVFANHVGVARLLLSFECPNQFGVTLCRILLLQVVLAGDHA